MKDEEKEYEQEIENWLLGALERGREKALALQKDLDLDLKKILSEKYNHALLLTKLEALPKESMTPLQQETLEGLALRKKALDSYEKNNPFSTNSYFDKEGKSMSYWDFTGYFNDPSYQLIKQERYGHFFVSTVWLGLNHNLLSDGPTLIFETMIFDEKDTEDKESLSDLHEYQKRYATLEEALKGHHEACLLAQKAASKREKEKESEF